MTTTNKIRHKLGKNSISKTLKSSNTPIIPEFLCQMLLRQASSADCPTLSTRPCVSVQPGVSRFTDLFDTGPHNIRISVTGPHKFLQLVVVVTG